MVVEVENKVAMRRECRSGSRSMDAKHADPIHQHLGRPTSSSSVVVHRDIDTHPHDLGIERDVLLTYILRKFA